MGIDFVLGRQRIWLSVGLVVMVGLAWLYVWQGAGMSMPAWDMTAANLFPHHQPDVPGDMGASSLLIVVMWWVMMITMMTPSAAPLILLYHRVLEHGTVHATKAGTASWVLLAGYLAAWLGFSIVAAMLQEALQASGLLSGMMWWSKRAWLSAALLAATGLYQWSPWKRACLAQCRQPVAFLTRYGRPGLNGAFMLGLRHGA